jgi:hypothetical protein
VQFCEQGHTASSAEGNRVVGGDLVAPATPDSIPAGVAGIKCSAWDVAIACKSRDHAIFAFDFAQETIAEMNAEG